MTEKRLFADVDLPFHVWVRERVGLGHRWVLREATAQVRDAAQARSETGAASPQSREPSSD